MAPRRGGGSSSGGSGGGLSVSCPGAFTGLYSTTDIAYFVCACLFFVFTLAILISLCCVKRRRSNAAKKILGVFFVLSLLAMLTGYALEIVGTMLRECGTTDYLTYFDWVIAFSIFWSVADYLLLVVVFWGINSALRDRTGSKAGTVKIASAVVLGIMFALTAGYIGISSYNTWTNTPQGFDSYAPDKFHQEYQLSVAYWVLYLLSVVAAGGLAITTLLSTSSRHLPSNGLLSRVIAVDVCMFIWVLFQLILHGTYLQNSFLGTHAYEAFNYLIDFFQTFSYIAIIVLATSRALENTATTNPNGIMYENSTYPPSQVQYAPVPPQQQQYAYNAQPGQQPYHQQQPMYNGRPVAEVK